MKKKKGKKTLQGHRKNKQSNMIFKDHIDRLSTDVRLNNNNDIVRGVIFFFRDFTFHISSFNTIRAKKKEKKNCEMIIYLSYDEVSD